MSFSAATPWATSSKRTSTCCCTKSSSRASSGRSDMSASNFHTATFVLSSAWRALGRHPLRAALTMLGITVGVGAVIAMVSMGQGATAVVLDRLDRMGSNMLYVEAGNETVKGVVIPHDTMMYDDVLAVRNECPAVALVAAHVNFRSQVAFENRNWNTQVRGVDTVYQQIRNWDLAEGEFFLPSAVTSVSKVAVL